ncbi:MAG: type II secretion system protein [Burkholderiaceae bacterium]|nr:type II secretion system protein [Burkholderiaceae bacterium]
MKPVWRNRRNSSDQRGGARRSRGFTLIDVLVMIVLLGVAAGTMTTLFARLGAQSAETMRARQSLALAQSLLDEVLMMPMTFCDPQDARAGVATRAAVGGSGCASTVDGLGPEPGESRYSAANRFDNVSDYQGFAMPGPGCAGGICDITGNLLNGAGSALAACSASVAVTPQALPGVAGLDADGRPQGLRVAVTLRCPGRADTLLEGVRLRHSPRT